MKKKPARLQCEPFVNVLDSGFATLHLYNFAQMPRRNMEHSRVITHFMQLLK